MYSCDGRSPHLDVPEMLVKEREVKRRITISSPGLVDEWSAGDVNCFDTHTLNIVQAINKSLEISTVSELGLPVEQSQLSRSYLVGLTWSRHGALTWHRVRRQFH